MRPFFARLRASVAVLLPVIGLACGSSEDRAGAGAGGASNSGGSAGSGATGGTGGYAGSGGSGGAAGGDSGTCGCVSEHIGWGIEGGLGLYSDTSALEVCNLFVHQRVYHAPDPPGVSCQVVMTNCADSIGPAEVMGAIAYADVRMAIAAAPVVYGEDPRPYDGQLLRMQIGSAIIDVGSSCRTPGCKPVPPGVNALASLLRALEMEQLARDPCSMIFPPPP